MTHTAQATELFHRWRAGDEDAARRLFELYSHKLRALADKNLSDRLGRRIDADDIVQSALRTFFRRTASGEFRIDTSADVWRLLVKITVAKARTQARHHTARKRDVRVEAVGSGEEQFYQAITTEPGPAEAAVLADLIETVLDALPDAHGEILSLCLQGHAKTDIARRLGISRQTVHRVLSLLQRRLQRVLGETEPLDRV